MLRTGAISTLQLRGLFTEAGHRGTTAVICSCSSRLSQRRVRPRGLAAYSNSIQQLRPCRSALLRRSGAQLPGISRCSLSTKATAMADVQTVARQQQRRGKHTPTPQPPTTPRELLQQHPQYPSLKDPSIVPLSVQDGSIVIRTATTSSSSSGSSADTVLLQNLNSNLPFNAEASVDGCLVFGARNTAGPSSVTNITLGSLRFKRFLACARNKLWWMTPEWGSRGDQLPPETQFLLLELEEAGLYGLVLPLIDGDFRGTLRPNRSWKDRKGEVCLRIESGASQRTGDRWDSILMVAAGRDPYHLVDAGVAAAAAMSGGAKPRALKRMPASLDGFGWCTWDAFYSTVSARGLSEGLSSLEAGGVNPQLLIIDDGWQLTDVDPPYGKAPAVAIAEKLEVEGPVGDLLVETKELLKDTQDDYYQESAKLLAETTEQLQLRPEVRNWFPTVANVGASPLAHHHSHLPADAGATGRRGDGSAGASTTASTLEEGAEGGQASEGAPLLSGDQQQQKGGGSMPAGLRRRKAAADAAAAAAAAAGSAQQPPPGASGFLGSPGGGPGDASGDMGGTLGKVDRITESLAQAATDTLKKAAPTPEQQFLLVRWAQKAMGALVGLGTAGFLIFYQWVIETAPPKSLRTKMFAAATQGFLRGAMLSFFASASDFTRRLTGVEANGKFARLDAGPEEDWEEAPADLGAVVGHIKARYGVKYVYCWHGLPAYWGGVMPGAPSLSSISGASIVFPTPTDSIAEVEPALLWAPAVLAGVGIADDPDALYSAMHAYLSSSGVDGVKVDCQAGVGLVGSCLGGGPAAARRFQAALENSIAQHFPGNHAINCMCHSSENFYRFRDTAVARVSDDFYPRDPASSTPHIGACAYNTMYLGALVQPDWDMFQSAHPAGELHAMARAVSGGAVYVSDRPGQHDFELLRRLVLPDGSTLRAALPGRPTIDTLFCDPLRDGESLLKVWNQNAVIGVVGVFHLQGSSWDRTKRRFYIHSRRNPPLSTGVRPHHVHSFAVQDAAAAAAAAAEGGVSDAAGDRQYACYCYSSGRLQVVGGGDAVNVELTAGKADLYWFTPVQSVRGVDFAPVGLTNMYNGGGAIQSVAVLAGQEAAAVSAGKVSSPPAALANGSSSNGSSSSGRQQHHPGVVASVAVRGCGRLLMYCSRRPASVWINLAPRDFDYNEYTCALEVEVPQLQELHSEVLVML